MADLLKYYYPQTDPVIWSPVRRRRWSLTTDHNTVQLTVNMWSLVALDRWWSLTPGTFQWENNPSL